MQAIVWWEDGSRELALYFLTTVTFGFASSSFLAIRTLRQLAHDEGEKFPLAVRTIHNQIYMDDILSGDFDFVKARLKQEQIMNLLYLGRFQLRKLLANDASLVDWLPNEMRAAVANLKVGLGFSVLGLVWDSELDQFYYNVSLEKLDWLISRRIVKSYLRFSCNPRGCSQKTGIRSYLTIVPTIREVVTNLSPR